MRRGTAFASPAGCGLARKRIRLKADSSSWCRKRRTEGWRKVHVRMWVSLIKRQCPNPKRTVDIGEASN